MVDGLKRLVIRNAGQHRVELRARSVVELLLLIELFGVIHDAGFRQVFYEVFEFRCVFRGVFARVRRPAAAGVDPRGQRRGRSLVFVAVVEKAVHLDGGVSRGAAQVEARVELDQVGLSLFVARLLCRRCRVRALVIRTGRRFSLIAELPFADHVRLSSGVALAGTPFELHTSSRPVRLRRLILGSTAGCKRRTSLSAMKIP